MQLETKPLELYRRSTRKLYELMLAPFINNNSA